MSTEAEQTPNGKLRRAIQAARTLDSRFIYDDPPSSGDKLKDIRGQIAYMQRFVAALDEGASPDCRMEEKNSRTVLEFSVLYDLAFFAEELVNRGAKLEDVREDIRNEHPYVVSLLLPDEVTVHSFTGGCFLTEAFNFVNMERTSFWRERAETSVLKIEREIFSAIEGCLNLKKAFELHKKRGGTVAENQLFARALEGKMKLQGAI